MENERKYVLTVAGFDPSGGAGVLADIKTFENHKVYGLAVNTANTIQTEHAFHSLRWETLPSVLKTIEVLMNAYEVSHVKIGIVPSFGFLTKVTGFLKNKNKHVKIIVDPVITSSSGFDFQSETPKNILEDALKEIYLLTPNVNEALALTGKTNAYEAALELSKHCKVLLKGGHSKENKGVDVLYSGNKKTEFKPSSATVFPKHGSGCILSAAIVSNLALDLGLEEACRQAKLYTEKTLMSNSSLLAYHV